METVLACRWGDNRLKTRFGSETLVFSRMKSWVAESMSALIHFVCAAKVDKAMFIYLQPTFTNKKPLTKPQINALEMECADRVRQRLNRLTSHFCLSKSGPELVLKRKVQNIFYAVKQPTNNGPRTSIELKSQKRSSSQGRRRRRNVGKTDHVAGDPHAFGDDAQAQVKNEQHVEDVPSSVSAVPAFGDDAQARVKNEQHIEDVLSSVSALPTRRGRGPHLFKRQRSRSIDKNEHGAESEKRPSTQGRRRSRNVAKTEHVASDPHALRSRSVSTEHGADDLHVFGDDAQAHVKNEQHDKDAPPSVPAVRTRRGKGVHTFESSLGSKPESIGMARDRSEPRVFSASSAKRLRCSGGNRLFETALRQAKH